MAIHSIIKNKIFKQIHTNKIILQSWKCLGNTFNWQTRVVFLRNRTVNYPAL